MGNTKLNDFGQVFLPGGIGKAGSAVYEVYAQVIKAGILGGFNGIVGLPGIVSTLHVLQVFIAKRLHANTKTGYRSLPERLDIVLIEVVGVSFKGTFF